MFSLMVKSVLGLAFAAAAVAQAGSGCEGNTEFAAPGFWWSCAFPAFCANDYNAFPQRAAKYREPLTETQLASQLHRMRTGQVKILTSIPAGGLRPALLDALNARFLFEGNEDRPVRTVLIRDQVYPHPNQPNDLYRERQLLFSDPYVGTFKGILLTPEAPAGRRPVRYPAVVALHGHSETAEVYRDTYFAREYPRHGIGILIITSRVMEPWLGEYNVAKNLLLNGFSLMALHSYEALIALKYLDCNPEVKPGSLGLIGHSGGSSAGNLLVRLAPKLIEAYVSDLTIDYSMLDIPEPYHCETIPNVHPYHRLINDFDTSRVPVLPVGYGYQKILPDGKMVSAAPDILRFFGRLKN